MVAYKGSITQTIVVVIQSIEKKKVTGRPYLPRAPNQYSLPFSINKIPFYTYTVTLYIFTIVSNNPKIHFIGYEFPVI